MYLICMYMIFGYVMSSFSQASFHTDLDLLNKITVGDPFNRNQNPCSNSPTKTLHNNESHFVWDLCAKKIHLIFSWNHYLFPKISNFKVWRTNFLTFFSWSWQWCRKKHQIMNLFWTTFLSINIQRYLNFGTFYYIIDNFSCCWKFECLRETISLPHFDPQERYT